MEQQHGYVPPKEDARGPTPAVKRLVICCDGTWQASNHATQEIPSNVAKISHAISKTYVDKNNQAAPQIVYYDAGVATAGVLDKALAGYFGSGLDENVCEAYNFLANNYNPGDEVFFFGFSRGAYTARATAGLVARVGICQDIQMPRFWEMYNVYKSKDFATPIEQTTWGKYNKEIAEKREEDMEERDWLTITPGDDQIAPYKVRKGDGDSFLSYCHKPVNIKVVGVFDTVGSLGYPENRFVDVSKWNKPYAFHNTDLHPEIENAFHALALDERRKPFGPTMWNMPESNDRTTLIQCWFPGVHVNIGGGSEDGLKRESKGDLETMANTTFAWMVDRCRPFLRFEDKVLAQIMSQYFKSLERLAVRLEEAQKKDPKLGEVNYGWGVGPYQKDFKGLMNYISGDLVRTPGHYPAKRDTREYIHPVVWHAQNSQNYASPALEGFTRMPNGDGQGHSWVKIYTPKDVESWSEWVGSLFNRRTVKKAAEAITVTIPEFVIPKMVEQQGPYSHRSYWANPLERLLIVRNLWTEAQSQQAFESEEQFRKRVDIVKEKKAASEYLMKLDRDNRATKFIGEDKTWGTPVEGAK